MKIYDMLVVLQTTTRSPVHPMLRLHCISDGCFPGPATFQVQYSRSNATVPLWALLVRQLTSRSQGSVPLNIICLGRPGPVQGSPAEPSSTE